MFKRGLKVFFISLYAVILERVAYHMFMTSEAMDKKAYKLIQRIETGEFDITHYNCKCFLERMDKHVSSNVSK